MTREKIINKLKELRDAKYSTDEILLPLSTREMLDEVIRIISVPEPQGLDEAAEFDKMFEDFCDQHPDGLTLNECAEFFYDKGRQAGAEWMAEQGVNADFGVCKLANRAWLTPIDEKRFVQDVFDNFTAGDKVVVQIRKKE